MQNKIFDICGTLYESNTTMDFCEFRCESKILKSLLVLSKTLPSKALNKILIKLFDFDMIRNFHIYSLKNKTTEQLDKDANFFIEEYLEFKKIDKVHKKLEAFPKEDIILVSATINPIAKAISEKLGNLKYLSTTLQYKDGVCLGKISKDLLGKKHKYFYGQAIEFIITDNKSDYDLCLMAKEIIIVSKKKNKSFWQSKALQNYQIIEV